MKSPVFHPRFEGFQEIRSVRTALLHDVFEFKSFRKTDFLHIHDALLFIAAYPEDNRQHKLALRALRHLSQMPYSKRGVAANTGLPFSITRAYYTPDCLLWLMEDCKVEISLEGFDFPEKLNLLLRHTVPAWLRTDIDSGLEGLDLLALWSIRKQHIWAFLYEQLSSWSGHRALRESLWELCGPTVTIRSRESSFSRTFNRLQFVPLFFSDTLLRRFDSEVLLNTPLPQPLNLSLDHRVEVEKVCKLAMIFLARETDPTTYMCLDSIRFFQLDRGISIALYGMDEERQLPFESYIGFTLFKNGWPCAYGGSWVFGKKAKFGMNVFEPYRGGESGYIMCQLLRTYKQYFDLESIEVEAFQFGLDNEDGIKSGAYWFYYRYGFRSMDKGIALLAEKEKEKMSKRPGYRSSEAILRRFTKSSMQLKWGNSQRYTIDIIIDEIYRMNIRQFRNNHAEMERKALELISYSSDFLSAKRSLREMALLAMSLGKLSNTSTEDIYRLAELKDSDEYAYQRALRQWMSQE